MGPISQRANDERLPAQTIERECVLAHVCADIGPRGDPRLVFKGAPFGHHIDAIETRQTSIATGRHRRTGRRPRLRLRVYRRP